MTPTGSELSAILREKAASLSESLPIPLHPAFSAVQVLRASFPGLDEATLLAMFEAAGNHSGFAD